MNMHLLIFTSSCTMPLVKKMCVESLGTSILAPTRDVSFRRLGWIPTIGCSHVTGSHRAAKTRFGCHIGPVIIMTAISALGIGLAAVSALRVILSAIWLCVTAERRSSGESACLQSLEYTTLLSDTNYSLKARFQYRNAGFTECLKEL